MKESAKLTNRTSARALDARRGGRSLAGASNTFHGQTEAALIIKPYIPHMTGSEIMALMTTGMATIATGVMLAIKVMGMLIAFVAVAAWTHEQIGWLEYRRRGWLAEP